MSNSRTQFAILSILRAFPMSGYEIHTFCKQAFSHFWNESYGQIYPTLVRLKDQGLIRPVDGDGEGSRATEHEITEEGFKILLDWLEEPTSSRTVRDEILLKLFSGVDVAPETMRAHIAKTRQEGLEQLRSLKGSKVGLDEQVSDHPNIAHWHLMIRSGELTIKARLQWCDEVDALLDEQPQIGEA